MEIAAAQSWLDALGAGAVAIWLIGTWFVAATARRRREPIRGELHFEGEPRGVLRRVAEVLVRGLPGLPLQAVALDRVDDREAAWHGITLRHTGTVRVVARGSGSSVTWQVVPGRRMMTAARAMIVAGACVTLGIYLLLDHFVARSAQAGLRFQVFQMVQAIHVLWPPYLLAGLTRALDRRLGDAVTLAIRNASFTLTT